MRWQRHVWSCGKGAQVRVAFDGLPHTLQYSSGACRAGPKRAGPPTPGPEAAAAGGGGRGRAVAPPQRPPGLRTRARARLAWRAVTRMGSAALRNLKHGRACWLLERRLPRPGAAALCSRPAPIATPSPRQPARPRSPRSAARWARCSAATRCGGSAWRATRCGTGRRCSRRTTGARPRRRRAGRGRDASLRPAFSVTEPSSTSV